MANYTIVRPNGTKSTLYNGEPGFLVIEALGASYNATQKFALTETLKKGSPGTSIQINGFMIIRS